jgi:ATP-binding cassette subfamily C protein LapB
MLGNPHASEQEMLQALRISGALSLVPMRSISTPSTITLPWLAIA